MRSLTVKMISGKIGEHCDIYCHGSYHKIKPENGIMWTEDKRDAIPNKFPFTFVEIPADTKACKECKNIFDHDWPFLEEKCVRCYERLNFLKRDEYREAVRQELIKELRLKEC